MFFLAQLRCLLILERYNVPALADCQKQLQTKQTEESNRRWLLQFHYNVTGAEKHAAWPLAVTVVLGAELCL